MNLTLDQIAEGFVALQEIGAEKLPLKSSFLFQRNLRLLMPEAEGYERVRIDLIKTKYGKKQKDGNFLVPQDNLESYLEEMKELGKTTVDLDIRVIKTDEVPELQISPIQLNALEWMFVNMESV
jgi:hypothetical protein